MRQTVYEKDLDTIEELVNRNGFNVVVGMMKAIADETLGDQSIVKIMEETSSKIALGEEKYLKMIEAQNESKKD